MMWIHNYLHQMGWDNSACTPSTKTKKRKKLLKSPLCLTFAFFPGCGIQGITVKPPPAAFAMAAFRVPQAFEAPPTYVVTHSQCIQVHVAAAFAPLTWTRCTGLSEGVTIVTVFTHLAAHPYTGVVGGWRKWTEIKWMAELEQSQRWSLSQPKAC